jgi:tRNA threonylcarbamoyladenosine biosynthesis protein TsaB
MKNALLQSTGKEWNCNRMNLLAVDTATAVLSLALAAGDNTWYFEADAGLRHSELLLDSIDTLLQKAGLGPRDISGVVCMGGPGSFTGLRIGFAFAKGLALGLGIPFAPVPTLDCIAYPVSAWPGIAASVIDAKKNAFFCALYRKGKKITADMDAGPEEIQRILEDEAGGAPVLLAGPDAEMLRQKLPAGTHDIYIEPYQRGGYARYLLAIAKKTNLLYNGRIDWLSGPEYIRKSDAEIAVQ